ncbi:glycosyltransferase family 2 protein [candidate division KSB1 bacterium]
MAHISVIIPTLNRVQPLRQAITSVLEQTYQDFEIIIVDDGSSDETFERFNKKKLPIKYYYQPNMGVSAARNRGIQLSNGEYIALLDSDDLWKPEKLELQFEFMENNKDILICQTDEIWIRNGKRVNPGKVHEKPDGRIFDRALELCIVSPSAVMMRREFFEIVGMFDENLPVCEDYDLWLRTAYRIEVPLLNEKLTIKHGGHPDQLSHAYWGMDRFRIYALQKLLKQPLSDEQRMKVLNVIKRKSTILRSGALKRGRFLFAGKAAFTSMFPGKNWRISY